MPRFHTLLTDYRILALTALLSMAALALSGANIEPAAQWALLLTTLALILASATQWHRSRHARRQDRALESMLEQADATEDTNARIQALRHGIHQAIEAIRRSRLGQGSGREALYALPWYITIGNPSAGKSSAILRSGLTFPFENGSPGAVQGIGGTRNCDWFFTTEGVLLDTAGRYTVQDEDRHEWRYFLDQLRKHRPRAPINGIIVTASLAELASASPESIIALARKLRQRIQELTERLEVIAPAYVMFTKADQIPGFSEFFQDIDWNERDRVWGATLPYQIDSTSHAGTLFDTHFTTLHDGLRQLAVAQLTHTTGDCHPPGLISFPLAFANLQPALRSFIATLFESNPYQFEPVFRGFYFTSALQDGTALAANDDIAARFGLRGDGPAPSQFTSSNGFFLRDLFSRVIFADHQLVRQHFTTGKTRRRAAIAITSVAALGIAIAGWSQSYLHNQTLTQHTVADLEQAARIQDGRLDLQSRLIALAVLQERIAQLDSFEHKRPLSLGLGLYQGAALRDKLLQEYYRGVRSILLAPVTESLEAFLRASLTQTPPANHPASASALNAAPAAPHLRQIAHYVTPDPSSTEETYKALKTYLMLSHRDPIEIGHLSDQLTRFWRQWLEDNRGAMPRTELIRRAEQVLTFHLARHADTAWPLIETRPDLVDQTRTRLRTALAGTPAAERVYAEIKTRAATRFPAITVAGLVGTDNEKFVSGNHVVSGAFTRAAWTGFVSQALHDAANGELQARDWVLQHTSREDLTLQGSPAQIHKTLLALYRQDYIEQWSRLLQGVSIPPFDDFEHMATAIDRLGDPVRSPLLGLLQRASKETGWDSASTIMDDQDTPSSLGRMLDVLPWRSRTVTDTARPTEADPADDGSSISTAFTVLGRLFAERSDGAPLADRYFGSLAQLRTRLRDITLQGDPGPGAISLIRETLDSGPSELSSALHLIDDHLLAGATDAQRALIRPLLVRPLQQTFAATVPAAERELNKIWRAQVVEPYLHDLDGKYPFAAEADIEATPVEIARIFGPTGAVAQFLDKSLGTLVVRRGNIVAPRTWGEHGITLHGSFIAGVPQWVGVLDTNAAPASTGPAQTIFMILPQPVAGTTAYLIEIDGQRLEYRNDAAQWASFVWPNPGASPGARILATLPDGSTRELIHFPGPAGLENLINSAERTRLANDVFRLQWHVGEMTLSLGLRIISRPPAGTPGSVVDARLATLPRQIAGSEHAQGTAATSLVSSPIEADRP